MADDRVETLVAPAWLVAAVVVGVLVTGVAGVTLSLTVRAALVAGLFVLALALTGGYPTVPSLGMVVIATAFATGMYVPLAFGYGPPVAALCALVLMVLSVTLVYHVQEGTVWVTRRTVGIVVVVLVVAGAASVAVDLQVGDVSYSVTVHDEVRLSDEDRTVTVGTATARSHSPLREPVSFPELRACLYAGDGREDVGWLYGGATSVFPRSVPAGGTTTVDVRVLVNETQAKTTPPAMPVEQADACPAERDEPGIVVVVRPGA